ncbi:MAG: enoyl-CoA hydratase-related protein [Thermodesulfobacteriota bacterium]
MEYTQIAVARQGAVRTITLNRPDIRNVITGPEIIEELCHALAAADSDDSVSALVLTGAGSAFSAGGNVKEMAEQTGMFSGSPAEIAESYRNGIQRIPLAMAALSVPVIAAVNGPAIGAGNDLCCMADIRIASANAKFGETFASLGLIPGDGGAFFLPRILGYPKALELALTCRILDAGQALAIGLVNEVVPPDQLLPRALAVASEIAAKPRATIRMTKRLFQAARTATLQEILDMSAACQGACHHLPEHRVAAKAFMEKQKTKK